MSDVHVMPTSFAEQRFWLLDQINPGAAAYTIPVTLRLAGTLDPSRLAAALNVIVARHESLRTVFALEQDLPVQIVRPTLTIALPVVEPDGRDLAAREATVRNALLADANQGFDLARGPLIRGTVYRLASDDHILSLALHHIIADAWSVGILLRELGTVYEALLAGAEPNLAALPLQYADFSVWQRRAALGATLRRQLNWWTAQLRAPLPALELPTDHPRPAALNYDGAKREVRLPASLVEQMRALARTAGATPFVAFLAAFQVLLSRWSGQEDVIVGSLTSGRNRAETQPLIGLFLNTLAIRADLAARPSFTALIGAVRETVLGALANQDVPFEMVVDAVQPAWDRSRSPIFQAAFQLLEGFEGELALAGVKASRVPAVKDTTKFELTLMLHPAPGGELRAVIEYSTELYDPDTIDRMLHQYQTLLAEIVREPSRPVDTLPILPPAERSLLDRWNNTGADYSRDSALHDRFEAQVDRTPEAVALEWDGGTMTYAELDRRSNRLARRLVELGIGPDIGVGICAERSPDLIVAMLAALKAGGYYVPLDPDYPAERLAYMVSHCRPPVLLVQRRHQGLLPATGAAVICLDDPELSSESERLPMRATPHNLAYVIYTSGSTGRPKGVMIPRSAVVNYLDWMQAAYPVGPDDAVLQRAPASFDISVWEIFLPLLAGARLVLSRPGGTQDPGYLSQALIRHGVTVMQLVPSQLLLMLESGTLGACRTVRHLFCGGEALPSELVTRLATAMPWVELTNFYGPTEATVYATYWTLDRSRFDGIVPIGRPMSNYRVYIMDRSEQQAPIGVPGELCIGGAGVGLGYLHQPELTAEKFLPDPFRPGSNERIYRTGDLARWRADGTLEYLGRLDHQVKLRGFRIELGEIEAVLSSHADLQGAVAVVREDVAGDKRLIAYVVGAGSARPPVQELRELVKARLPEYMVPSAIVFLDRFPLSANGKVDRKALPVPDGSHDTRVSEPPRTPLEAAIAAAMAEVLGRAAVGVTDGFFELGGHSLLAMRLLGRLRKTLDPELTLQAIFEHPTAAGLASTMKSDRIGGASIPRREDRVTAPLSFSQELLWVQGEMDPSLAAYNIPIARRLRGPLNPASFQRAVDGLVQRHEVLRTTIGATEAGAVQQIHSSAAVQARVVDLRERADAEEVALAGATREAAAPFDLARDPLLRVSLWQIGEDDHLLLLVVHHIIADGASLHLLLDDLATLYAAERSGIAASLAPLPIQYGDYAAWQRNQLTGDRLERLLEYWTVQLAGAPASLDLATDRPRTGSLSGPGAESVRLLSPDLLEQLRAVARAHNATLYMVLAAAWQTLLHRYTAQTDIVIGTPIAGRMSPETERVVGLFVNTLMMRARLDDDPSFATLLDRTRTTSVDAFGHAELPLERLAQALRETSGSAPLFQVGFVLQDGSAVTTDFAGISVLPVRVHSGAAKFELSLSMTELPEGLRATLEYRADLFDAATVERMQDHFATLLEGIVSDPSQAISRLPMLPEAERRMSVEEWNAGSLIRNETGSLIQRFEEQAARWPDRVALEHEQERLTYADLNSAANRVAQQLRELEVGSNTLVALCADRSLALVIGLLGILKAGGAYVPIDLTAPAERVKYILEDSEAPVVLVQEHLRPRLPAGPGAVLVIEQAVTRGTSVNAATATSGDDLAYVIYTSGSTGKPKGVQVTHHNVTRLFDATAHWYEFGPEDVWTLFHSYAFDFSVWEVWGALLYGGRVVVVPYETSRSPEAFIELVARKGVTVLNQTPSAFRQFVQADEAAGTPPMALRWVIFGGEALDMASLAPWFGRRGDAAPRLVNMYGITETTVHVTYRPLSAEDLNRGSVIGVPIPDLAVYVLDPNGQPLPIGVPGELFVGGAGVARGYLHQPELTAQRFLPSPFRPGDRLYRTGDRVRWLAGRDLEYLGRLDFQVKIRGFRIELGEIEAALGEHSDIRESVVLCREDRPGDKRLVAYYVPRAGREPVAAELRSLLRASLPEYMVPSAYVPLQAMPVTVNGKLDRRALPPPADDTDAEAVDAEPRNEVESAVARIWREVLHRPSVGIDRSFFDLGGHSLLVTQVVGRLSKLFRMRFPLRAFFAAPTVAGVAASMLALEPKPGHVDTIARVLEQIERMSEDERRTRVPETGPAPAGRPG